MKKHTIYSTQDYEKFTPAFVFSCAQEESFYRSVASVVEADALASKEGLSDKQVDNLGRFYTVLGE